MYRVFRLETKEELGSYSSGSPLETKYEDLLNLHNSDSGKYPSGLLDFGWQHPIHQNDYFKYDPDYRFCTPSFCMFMHWFGSEFENLKDDMLICIYTVKKLDLGESGYQGVFNINDVVKKKILHDVTGD